MMNRSEVGDWRAWERAYAGVLVLSVACGPVIGVGKGPVQSAVYHNLARVSCFGALLFGAKGSLDMHASLAVKDGNNEGGQRDQERESHERENQTADERGLPPR